MTDSESANFVIDTIVRCVDGECGTVHRLIVEPTSRSLTHLVVTSARGFDRLVPIDTVEAIDGAITLKIVLAEFEALDTAERLLPGGIGLGMSVASKVADVSPVDEISVSGREEVEATDGRVGRIKGLVVDRSDNHLIHLLLAEGHLWGTKEVTIPVDGATRFDPESVQLNVTKEEAERISIAE